MPKLKNTRKTAEIKFDCEFCGREFSRQNTLLTHTCEPKRRWQDKDKKPNVLGLSAWIQFYSKNGKKKKDYDDFIKSPYYMAFVKFGIYCTNVNVLNIARYVDWLLKEKISIDSWNKDKHYTKFIIEYCRDENPFDAIARSIETSILLAETNGIQTKDVLRYGNINSICYEITKGKISPWMLYHSDSGLNFLSNLDDTQRKMIFEYIDPEYWALKFHKQKHVLSEIKNLLSEAGY